MTENSMLQWALYYQSQGLSIIPVKGKTPLIKWKEFQERKASEKEIKMWWKQWPEADIGCVTGEIYNKLVLDIDGPQGFESTKKMDFGSTKVVRTLRGKQHHYQWPKVNISKTTLAGILPSVDIRGNGGYVKLPPSTFSDGSGRYEWEEDINTPLAECPLWLIDLLTKNSETSSTVSVNKESWLEDILDGVGEGERHEALVKLAGYYYNCMKPENAAQHLREWNKKNRPPYKEAELEEQIRDFDARFKRGEYTSRYLETLKEQSTITLLSAAQVVEKYSNRIEYLVEGIIPVGSSVIFSGYQGLGKTFVSTDLIIEVSRKKGTGKWMGTFPTKKGPVLFVDNENSGNLTSYRLQQLLGPKGLTIADLDLHYYIRNRIKLTNDTHYFKLKETIRQLQPSLIVLDSFASTHSLDENSSKDIRYYFDELIAPICDEFKCSIMLIDHETKGSAQYHQAGNKRLRGSGAKGDSVDAVISLDYQDGVLLFEHSKSRFSRKTEPFSISIDTVHNGIIIRNMGKLHA